MCGLGAEALLSGYGAGTGERPRTGEAGERQSGPGVSDGAGPQDRRREARATQSLRVLPAQNWAGGGGTREGALQLTRRGQQGAAALLDPGFGGRRLGVPVRAREEGTRAL